MPKKRKSKYEMFTGRIFDLGSRKKNRASVRRSLKNQGFKGRFIVVVSTTPKIRGDSVRYRAVRKKRK